MRRDLREPFDAAVWPEGVRLQDFTTEHAAAVHDLLVTAYLDGGGSVAADQKGNVYVAWHAPEPGKTGEVNRRVWLAVSTDDGETFARERAVFEEATGACGCCGMRAFADGDGTVYLLYRSAKESVHRDM